RWSGRGPRGPRCRACRGSCCRRERVRRAVSRRGAGAERDVEKGARPKGLASDRRQCAKGRGQAFLEALGRLRYPLTVRPVLALLSLTTSSTSPTATSYSEVRRTW